MEKLKDSDAKEYKKFITDFIHPYFEEVRHILKQDTYQTDIMAECLRIIHLDTM